MQARTGAGAGVERQDAIYEITTSGPSRPGQPARVAAGVCGRDDGVQQRSRVKRGMVQGCSDRHASLSVKGCEVAQHQRCDREAAGRSSRFRTVRSSWLHLASQVARGRQGEELLADLLDPRLPGRRRRIATVLLLRLGGRWAPRVTRSPACRPRGSSRAASPSRSRVDAPSCRSRACAPDRTGRPACVLLPPLAKE